MTSFVVCFLAINFERMPVAALRDLSAGLRACPAGLLVEAVAADEAVGLRAGVVVPPAAGEVDTILYAVPIIGLPIVPRSVIVSTHLKFPTLL